LRSGRALPAALAALVAAAFGCQDPFASVDALTVRGYLAGELLPADREVGSWRRPAKGGGARSLTGRDFRKAFGEDAFERTRPWGLGESASASYRLGETGRAMTVEIYDLGRAKGAFDIYSFIREKALAGEKPAGKVAKVGVQGLLSSMEFGGTHADGPFSQKLLLFWAERFLVVLTHRVTPGSDERADASEAALLAFGAAVTARLKQPYELPEVYALQVPGEAVNSERCQPDRLFRRRELPDGVTARWQGRTGAGTLFISVADSSAEAAKRFERLCRAADGKLNQTYAEGLFTGNLAGSGPVICFRWGKALAGLVGAAEAEERMAAVEEIRKRCAGEAAAPAAPPEGAR
jgi:hypothetical protein